MQTNSTFASSLKSYSYHQLVCYSVLISPNLRSAVFPATARRNFPNSSRETACALFFYFVHLLDVFSCRLVFRLHSLLNLLSVKVHLAERSGHLLLGRAHHRGDVLRKISQLGEHFHHLQARSKYFAEVDHCIYTGCVASHV